MKPTKYIYDHENLMWLPYRERIGFWSRFTIGSLLTGICVSWFVAYHTGSIFGQKKALKQDSTIIKTEFRKEAKGYNGFTNVK